MQILQTPELLKDVPNQPGEMYQTYNMGGNATIRMRVRSAGHEWWTARQWGEHLQSVIVKGHRWVSLTCCASVSTRHGSTLGALGLLYHWGA